MVLKLYNTLTRQKEEFKPIHQEWVGLYTCGPTVYNYAHIGNLRSFTFSDTLRRVLEYNGYQVKQVMNVTDVDDKTIRASQNTGESLKVLTRRFEEFFLADLEAMNIKRPDVLPRASEHIAEMLALVDKLLATGLAYQASDGVYFKISSFPHYGQLSKVKLGDSTQERISNDEYEKENARDFALWKFHTPDDGEVTWDAPWGRGRPGWHIECSAMSMKYLGEHFDIHTGGVDLIFPHHENEIAQSAGATKMPFVNFWLHSGFVNINDQKMAKSLGNILRLDDLVQEGISPLAYRLWLLMAHYRTTVNFTIETGRAAQTTLARLKNHLTSLPDGGQVNEKLRQEFLTSINDDLDTAHALTIIPTAKDISPADEKATWLEFNKVLGLKLDEPLVAEIIPDAIQQLAAEREQARQNKDWSKADELRQEIEKAGYLVDDTDNGPRIRAR